jgi:hypothetical protein
MTKEEALEVGMMINEYETEREDTIIYHTRKIENV